MLKLFSKNRNIKEDQQLLFFYLEKIVNITLAKTERGDNQSVKEILKDLEYIFRKFWQLKKDNPDKFEAFLWSKDFLENYVQPIERGKSLIKEDSKEAKSAEELKQEAALLLSFSAETKVKGLTQFLESFKKIWECSFRCDNDEISRCVIDHLNWLLAELTREPLNNLFVEQFLKLLHSITWKAIKSSEKEMNASVFAASIYWYIDIVFNRLRQREKSFDLCYLELFNDYFFSSVRCIISRNQTSLFNNLVSSLVDRVTVTLYYSGKIWDYDFLIRQSGFEKYQKLNEEYRIGDRIERLDSEKDLHTREKLNKWIEKFDELKQILEPNFNKEQKKKAKEIESEIKEFVISQYKYNNLLEIVFAIGAYCLFKQKPDYIKYLWEYKQPPDSDASWIGHNIIPSSIKDVINFYFRKGLFERRVDFLEGHHGSESYYKKYLILLLSRIMQTIKPNVHDKYEQIENYSLPKFHIYRLSNLEHSIDELVGIAKDIKGQPDILGKIGFDTTKIDETFDEKLIPFLQSLKEKSQEQIGDLQRKQPTSPKKIEEFKEQVLKGFSETVILRNIFKHYKLYEDKTNEKYRGKPERFGINIVADKAAFFEEWHVRYGDYGSHDGTNLASGENSYILEKIANCCKEVEEIAFEKILEKFSNLSEIVIFAVNVNLYRFFENSKNFKPKGYKDNPQLKIRGVKGWYVFKNQYIPIFEVYERKTDQQIMILNKSKIGELIQYSPLKEGDNKELKKDIFYMNVRAFSENDDLMNEFLKKPPEWLKRIGGEDKQREHLEEKILLHIFERFEYNKSQGFEGYLLRIK